MGMRKSRSAVMRALAFLLPLTVLAARRLMPPAR
jgi:hypothetical protein